MILRETEQMEVKRYIPRTESPSCDLGGAGNAIVEIDLSSQERSQLLDVAAWSSMLEIYGRTMKVAVALTDPNGTLLGQCRNAQPIWALVRGATNEKVIGCSFCLTRLSPCTAVADALRTGLPTMTRDQAGLTHVAVPLTLGRHLLGAIIAGQVLDRYPDSLLLERAAKRFGVSFQLLWDLSSKQRPISHVAMQMAGDLLSTLGQAFVRQRYGAILEARIAQTNGRFRSLVEGVTDYALFTTDHVGRVTSWNIGAERMLGYPEATILGQYFSRIFTVDDIEGGVPEKQLLKAYREGRAEDEGWRVREDQTQLWADVIITPLLEEEKADSGFAVVMENVTDRRKAAIELEAARQERINLQERFLSHVSHELRTPLTALYFFITNLLDGVVGDLPLLQREHLEFSLENVKQLRDMVDDLLDVSRIETLKLNVKPRQFVVSRLIEEALRTCRGNAVSKNIRLGSHIASDLPSAWADRARLLQVLVNLIDNAIKFTPDSGAVTLGAQLFADDRSFLCLSVSDTGCGITPDQCEMVFDRLAQVKASTEVSRKGLGLGLFISRELVVQQHGRIWVDSQVGRGSTFSFTVPVFSVATLCESIFTPSNLMAGCVTVIVVDVPPIVGEVQTDYLAEIRAILERSILAGHDLLLPAAADNESATTLFIIACAETSRVEAISSCLREALDDFDCGSRAKPRISATTLRLAANELPWKQRIVDVSRRIEKLIQARLLDKGYLG